MTNEEAINLLINATYSNEWQGNEELTTAHLMAIDALRKQILKKPIFKPSPTIRSVGVHKCPVCGEHVMRGGRKYYFCQKCGQALDWEEEK